MTFRRTFQHSTASIAPSGLRRLLPTRARPRRVLRSIASLAIWTLGASTLGCMRGGQGAQAPPPAVVSLATLQPTQVDQTSEYVATIKSLKAVTVQPQVDGIITRVFVKSGDRVKQGQALMQIDPSRQRANVASQRATIGAREADVRYAEQQVARMRDLFAQKVVSKQELDQAETAVKTAAADLESLRARLREGNVQLQYFRVVAPSSGIVGDVPVRLGDRVTPDTMLTTLDQNDTLELYVPVPIERARELVLALPVDILDGSGEIVETTKISFVSPRAEGGTQSVLAKALVTNRGGTLRSSQYVRARIRWTSSEGLVIPVLSVLRVNNQSFVFVAEEDQGKTVARQRPIRVGPIIKDDYTVLAGLKAGDRIVTSGVQKLVDGAPIQPQGDAPAPTTGTL